MAEEVLIDIAVKVLEGLGHLALQELSLASNAKSELKKLENTIKMIKAGLADAEERHNSNNKAVTEWLRRLKDAVYDVDDLLDEFSTEDSRRKAMKGNEISKKVHIFFSKKNQLAYRLKIGHRVKALREEVDAIADDGKKFNFSTDRPLDHESHKSRETYSFVRIEQVIGREDDKNEMMKRLLFETSPEEETIRVVPIVGIGGLGKTTLAQMLFNDENFRSRFELKMWVCVSDRFEVKTVIGKIIEAATKNSPNDCNLETLQNRLLDVIRGKKYFLVLDDVWNEDADEWSKVRDLLMEGGSGSRIVVSTRSEVVGRITGTIEPYFLKGLSESQSLCLFKNIAFEKQTQTSNNPDPELETIGEKILDRCVGVPLAIKAIGRVLCSKQTKLEWSHVLENITQNGIIGIKPILRLSYDHLPSHLKQCFAYCSLFPQDYRIYKHELINLWMSQGFIQSEDVGHDYFMDLLWRSFFQEPIEDEFGNIEKCKMHDLMHDIAKSVAGTECSLITNVDADVENVDEDTRHVSLWPKGSDSSWKIPTSFLKANRMRTFFCPYIGYPLSEANIRIIIRSFKCLRMLDLKGSEREKLPDSISKLKHLRYLDLSYNENIRKLPNCLTTLQNLQILDLSFCDKLVELPRDIENLVSLKKLPLKGCENLKYLPGGVGQLSSLTTLDLFVVGKAMRGRQIGELRELDGLNKLGGQLKIKGLENVRLTPDESGGAYLKEKLFLESLELEWEGRDADNDEMVLESLRPHPNIKKLAVWGYEGAKFSNWLSSLTNLVNIDINYCSNCRYLPAMDHLPLLKFLTLRCLDALEHVSETETDTSTATTFFPALKSLEILECPNLKGWWRKNTSDEDEDEASSTQQNILPCFPRLSTLIIRHCPLSSIPLFPTVSEELSLQNTTGRPLQQTMRMKTMSTTTLPLSDLKSLTLSRVENEESVLEEFLQIIRRCICLESLTIGDFPELTSLPTEMRALNSLRFLEICDLPNLMVLPDWISNFTSLLKFEIWRCSRLQSLPEGMSRLKYLNSLRIIRCPQLTERCQRDIGADWTNISHVQDIDIDFRSL